MTIIAIKTFDGRQPKLISRRTADNVAQVAIWTKLDNRQLRAWRAPAKVAGPCVWIEPPEPPLPLPDFPSTSFAVVDDLTPVFSCYYNFNEIEVSPGVKEIWASYDSEDEYYNLIISRFDFETGAFLGSIRTEITENYADGGSTAVETDTDVWYFAMPFYESPYSSIVSVSKTGSHEVTYYDVDVEGWDEINVVVVADPAKENVWVRTVDYDAGDATVYKEWSLSTHQYTGNTKLLGGYSAKNFHDALFTPDGKFWAMRNETSGSRIRTLLVFDPGESTPTYSVDVPNPEQYYNHGLIYAEDRLFLLDPANLTEFDITSSPPVILNSWSVSSSTSLAYSSVAYDATRRVLWWYAGDSLIGFSLATNEVVYDELFPLHAAEVGSYGIFVDSLGRIWFQTRFGSTEYSLNVFYPEAPPYVSPDLDAPEGGYGGLIGNYPNNAIPIRVFAAFEVEVSAGSYELWVVTDSWGDPYWYTKVHRIDLSTREVIDTIDTSAYIDWSRGMTYAQTTTEVFLFVNTVIVVIQKSAPHTVVEYSGEYTNALSFPDTDPDYRWIATSPSNALHQWSLVTKSLTGTARALPSLSWIPIHSGFMESDGTIWYVYGTTGSYKLAYVESGGSTGEYVLPAYPSQSYYTSSYGPTAKIGDSVWVYGTQVIVEFDLVSRTFINEYPSPNFNSGGPLTVWYFPLVYDAAREMLFSPAAAKTYELAVLGFDLTTRTSTIFAKGVDAGTMYLSNQYTLSMSNDGNLWFNVTGDDLLSYLIKYTPSVVPKDISLSFTSGMTFSTDWYSDLSSS